MRNWHFHHIDFSTYPHYGGDDLGILWHPEKTVFRLWAPTAKMVELRIYPRGKGGKPERLFRMERAEAGTWICEVKGNLEGKFYTFKVNDGEWLHEVPDPHARAVGINGHRGMAFNPRDTDPAGWEQDRKPGPAAFTDCILYEVHVRDFSVSGTSGIFHKGKYLGFTEENSVSPSGTATGLSHLKEMGITHVHLLPVSDFQTVDDEFPLLKYNWGYDPQHFNAPEGSYSTDPADGTVRIRELKQLVKALHDHGIGVIFDMVYNHTWLTKGSVFNQTVPGYYYRQNRDGSFSNGSGCGNEIATERSMVRKFILDSLQYWAREYHADGFRFDLMGLFDSETMRHIRYELSKTNPHLLLYGEGWSAGPSPMQEQRRAVKRNISQLQGIAAFNDDLRDALKGNHGHKSSTGFVSGLALREEAVKFGIVAATWHPQIVYSYVESSSEPWASEPSQCINYVSCHDNYTLFDKLVLSLPHATDQELRKMVKLAGAVILTSQGIPFLHAGVEFCRTKAGHPDSYKAPDVINQLDWERKENYADVTGYFRKLISLRKNHPAFRFPSAALIRENLTFCSGYTIGVVAYCLKGSAVGDPWEEIVVLFNGNREAVSMQLPGKHFRIIARGEEINEEGLDILEEERVFLEPVCMTLLAR